MNGSNPFPNLREEGAVDQVSQIRRDTIQQLETLLEVVSKPTTAIRCANEIKSLREALADIEEKFRKKTDESEGDLTV